MDIIKKISKIKNKKELKKISINKPIWNKNYLHHYLAYSSRMDLFLSLDHKKVPIKTKDNNGDTIFHILAKNGNINFLKKVIELYPEYIYELDSNNSSFLNYIMNDLSNVKIIFNLLEKFKPKWKYLLEQIDNNNTTPILNAIYTNNVALMKYLFKKNYVVLDKKYYNIKAPLIAYIINNNLKEKQIIELFKLVSDRIDLKKIIDNFGYNLVFGAIEYNYFELLKYFKKQNLMMDYIAPISTAQPFRFAYRTNRFKIAKYILNTNEVDPDKINKYGDNLAHFLLGVKIWGGNVGMKSNWELEKKILPQVKNWHTANIYGDTPFHYLVQLKNIKKYIDILPKTIYVNFEQVDKDGKTIEKIANKKTLKLLNKFKKYELTEKNILIKSNKSCDINMYHANLHDISIYLIYLFKKYKNLTLPYLHRTSYTEKFLNTNFNQEMLHKNENLFPWLIYWHSEDNYIIHEELNLLINKYRRNNKYEYVIVFLSIRFEETFHANIFLYDLKNLTIERFEPLGNLKILDEKLDDIMKHELTWNTGMTYLSPKKFMNEACFQTISDETALYNQKPGDFGGYCLAWCIWYIEMRLTNSSIPCNKLVEKSINQLLKKSVEFIDYIRSYANLLGEFRIKFIKDICKNNKNSNCIANNRLHSINLYDNEINIIWNKIFETLKKN